MTDDQARTPSPDEPDPTPPDEPTEPALEPGAPETITITEPTLIVPDEQP